MKIVNPVVKRWLSDAAADPDAFWEVRRAEPLISAAGADANVVTCSSKHETMLDGKGYRSLRSAGPNNRVPWSRD